MSEGNNVRSHLVGPALLLSLSACEGVTISQQYFPQSGVPSHADYAASLGPTPVLMRNSPAPPASVIAALQQNNPRQKMAFTSEPLASGSSGYRVLLAFDEPAAGGMQICRDSFTGAAATANAATTRVYGAFCVGTMLLSEATATAPRLSGPTDPLLARIMGDLVLALMPANDHHQNSRGIEPPSD